MSQDDTEAREVVRELVDRNQGNLELLDRIFELFEKTLRRLHIVKQLGKD